MQPAVAGRRLPVLRRPESRQQHVPARRGRRASVPAALVLPLSMLLFVPLAHALTFAPGQGWVHFLPQFGYGAVGGWVAVLIYVMVLGSDAVPALALARLAGDPDLRRRLRAPHVRDAEDAAAHAAAAAGGTAAAGGASARGWSRRRAPGARGAPAGRCSCARHSARCGCWRRRWWPIALERAAPSADPALDLSAAAARAGHRHPRRRQRARRGARVRRRPGGGRGAARAASPTAPTSRAAPACRCSSRARPPEALAMRASLGARLRRRRRAGSRATRATPSRMRSSPRHCCAQSGVRAHPAGDRAPRTSGARRSEFAASGLEVVPAPTGLWVAPAAEPR